MGYAGEQGADLVVDPVFAGGLAGVVAEEDECRRGGGSDHDEADCDAGPVGNTAVCVVGRRSGRFLALGLRIYASARWCGWVRLRVGVVGVAWMGATAAGWSAGGEHWRQEQ
jgi:hypothetical protein